jgi:hypothetical protein
LLVNNYPTAGDWRGINRGARESARDVRDVGDVGRDVEKNAGAAAVQGEMWYARDCGR